MKERSCLLAVLLLAVAPSIGAAQAKPGAVLRGIVRDEFGTPIANARVQVADVRRRATSDSAGRFVLRPLPSGDTLNLIVARIGFRPLHVVLSLAEGETEIAVELEFTPQPPDPVGTAWIWLRR